jgi:DNA-binding transcriptional regulator LsrR (DeoR family)
MENKETEALLKELASFKKILILIASKSGATQSEIGEALGVSSRQVGNIVSGNR